MKTEKKRLYLVAAVIALLAITVPGIGGPRLIFDCVYECTGTLRTVHCTHDDFVFAPFPPEKHTMCPANGTPVRV